MRLAGGRNADEGRVEMKVNGQWGVICSDHWSLLEARVACGQLGRGYARTAMRVRSEMVKDVVDNHPYLKIDLLQYV